jgi:hypothetical protein
MSYEAPKSLRDDERPRRNDFCSAARRHGRRRRAGKNGIMILGPKDDGTYVVEFKIADGTAGVAALDRNAGGGASICSEAPRVRMISPSVCRSTLQSTPNLTPYAR